MRHLLYRHCPVKSLQSQGKHWTDIHIDVLDQSVVEGSRYSVWVMVTR